MDYRKDGILNDCLLERAIWSCQGNALFLPTPVELYLRNFFSLNGECAK